MNRRQSFRLLMGAAALAALPARAYAQLATDRPLWGQEMLTEQERNQFHTRMQNAQSEQERLQIREEHQAVIRQRAQERGIKVPPGAGQGMGQGMGQGRGQGMGQGMGQGQGQGTGQGQGMQDLLRKKGKSN